MSFIYTLHSSIPDMVIRYLITMIPDQETIKGSSNMSALSENHVENP